MELEDGQRRHDEVIEGLTLTGGALRDVVLEDVVIRNSSLEGVKLLGCHFTTCTFRDCILNSVDLAGSTLNGVHFERCRLMGTDFASVLQVMVALDFHDCLLDYSCFARMRLGRTRFVDCRMRDVDFSNAHLDRAVFTGSDLQGANFNHAVLTRAELHRATGVFFDPKLVTLGHTRIDLETLIAIGTRLGLDTDIG